MEVGAEGAERGGIGGAIAEWKVWGWGIGVNASLCHFETANEQGQSIKQGLCLAM